MRYLYLFFLVCILCACTKHVAGPKGEAGTEGKSGNLLKTQITIRKDSTDWKVNSGVWESTVYLSELNNKSIFNTCEVRVYMKLDSAWWSLPRMVDDYIIKHRIAEGYVKLNGYEFHGAPGHRPPSAEFRVVLLYAVQ